MTRSDLTHLYFLLDRSGSMQSIKSDIEGGFAAFVEEQRRGEGECVATLARFDDQYEVVFTDLPVDSVPALVLEPRGSTALHDSMGRLITETGATLAALPEAERPGNVVVAIMTDGHENASREWHAAAIKALVELQTTQYDWTVMYMGCDQDAVEVGAALGISPDLAITYGRGKSADMFVTASAKIRRHRTDKMANPAAAMPAFTEEERRSVAE